MRSRTPALIAVAAAAIVIGGGVAAYFLLYLPRQQQPAAVELPPVEPEPVGPQPDDPMVSIADQKVTYGEFDREWRKLESGLTQPLSPTELIPVRYNVLAGLARKRALDMEIEKRGVRATDEDVDSMAEQLAKEEIARRFPQAADLKEALKRESLSQEEYVKKVKGQVLEDREGVREQALTEKLGQLVTADVTVAPEEVEKYFQAVKIRRITVSTQPAGGGKPAVTDEQAEARINEIYRELKEGADFAQLAKTKSDHPSAANGGLYVTETGDEYIPRGMYNSPEFDNAAFSTDIGAFSKPFRTDTGWHIIKIEDKKSRPPKDLSTRREDYRAALERDLKKQYFNNWFEKLPESLGFEVEDPAMKGYFLQLEKADFAQAVRAYDEALDQTTEPTMQVAILHQESLCYHDLSLFEDAQNCMKRVEELADSFEVRFVHGEMYRMEGDEKNALLAFNKASELVGDIKDIDQQIAARTQLADKLQEMGSTVLAEAQRAKVRQLSADRATEPGRTPEEPIAKGSFGPEPSKTGPSKTVQAPPRPSKQPSGGPSKMTPPSKTTTSPPVQQPTKTGIEFPTNPYAR